MYMRSRRVVWIPVRARRFHPIVWFWLMALRIIFVWPAMAMWLTVKWLAVGTAALLVWVRNRVLASHGP
jgi:hypothetical protein